MQIGVIGLGRMGGNITRRLIQNGHEAVVYDHDASAVATLRQDGAIGAADVDKLVKHWRRRARFGSCCRPARLPKIPSTSLLSCLHRATLLSMAAIVSGKTMFGAAKS